MAPRTSDGALNTDRDHERQRYQSRLATALNEEDDPLATYHQFVQWTIKNYGENDPTSGLLELLKDATNQFKNDSVYKTDLRYLKLWALYARQVEKAGAISIYAYLVSNDIGTSYSALYEDYANLLEDEGRRQEADSIYRRGIKRGARPMERLKARYREFQSRGPPSSSASPSTSSPPVSASSSKSGTSRSNASRKDARGGGSLSPSTVTSVQPTTFTSTAASRYALMMAPPAPGKRPEKLRFNMGLLFTEEGVEYSIQEARARSMGLLGKKWGPPPPSESSRFTTSSSSSSSSSIAMVDFNDDGHKSSRMKVGGRRSLLGGPEPTVTINTKEALADVFGMYNSPEKTTMLAVPGSKHVPLKKIEPVTPVVAPRVAFLKENENGDRQNQNTKTPTPAFKPFVDENAQPNTRTPATKFTPFLDPDQQKTPFMTPRAILSVKEAHAAANPRLGENAPQNAGLKHEENPVFAKVFTPASKVPLAPLRDVFTDDHGKPLPKTKFAPTHERAKSQHETLNTDNSRPSAFTPFKDENARTPFKVFSRPGELEEPSSNAFTPKTPNTTFKPFTDAKTPAFTPFKDSSPVFRPFVDKDAIWEPKPSQPNNAPEIPRPTFANTVIEIEDDEEDQEPSVEPDSESDGERQHIEEQDRYYEEEDSQGADQYETPLTVEHLPDDYEEGESFQEVPLGGRFGQFNVMTPITERTFEFTTSTRGGTPSERYTGLIDDPQRAEYEAAKAAVLLANELREGDDEDYDNDEPQDLEPLRLTVEQLPAQADPDVVVIEEKTGSLSLLDTLTLSSKFRPSNPCNPFDPAILSSLISRIPTDPHFYDLRAQQSNMLDQLERFTKKSRKTSSRSNSGVLNSDLFPLTLQGHRFMVSEKLGEGGFGSVFKAKDMGLRLGVEDSDEDDELDDEDEDDEEVSSMVALKVVKPRNIWEYHVLRRLHTALPPSLRRSIVLPHALYAFGDESHLVLDLCPQGMLLNIINNAVSAGIAQAGACLDELLVMFFSIELLRLMESMHSAGFIHGDLKIDNCLLRLEEVPGGAAAWSGTYQPTGDGGWSYKGLKVIDFGRTIDMRLFPPDQKFIADWATDDRDCFEVRENRPWTYQTDYFGLAGIIYCMLFGKYIQASSVVEAQGEDGVQKHKIATPFKRYWQTELWTRLFDVLLNPCTVRPNGELPICNALGELRKEMEQWLQSNCNRTSNTLKGLLKKVEMACWR